MVKKPITNEDLARMINKGFDDHDKRFRSFDKRFDGIESRMDKVDVRLDNLEQGQEEIKIRLDNVVYRFEVEDLKKRVKKIELKVGVRKA